MSAKIWLICFFCIVVVPGAHSVTQQEHEHQQEQEQHQHAKSYTLSFDGFIDLYYAFDFNRPAQKERDYTTQPARHNEFNANLVLLGLNYQKDRFQTRISFQAGTYVQRNYSAEPTVGDTSGEQLARHIQDAFVTYDVSPGQTSLIAGIMPSHIGYEDVFSIDNYTYTRSIAADYTPYYQSGIGVIHKINHHVSIEGYILNGWQNISEDDSNKALASAIRFQTDRFHLNYSTFFGNYQQNFRHFHDINFEFKLSSNLRIKALYNLGFQKQPMDMPITAHFHTYNLQLYYHLTDLHRLGFRGEYYKDKHQAHIPTLTGLPFEVYGGSVNYDYVLEQSTLLRIEYRALFAAHDIFTYRNHFRDYNHTIVTSIASKF